LWIFLVDISSHHAFEFSASFDEFSGNEIT